MAADWPSARGSVQGTGHGRAEEGPQAVERAQRIAGLELVGLRGHQVDAESSVRLKIHLHRLLIRDMVSGAKHR
jgi:ribosomal protein S5